MSDTLTTTPVLLAYPGSSGGWRVWCDWCERWHTHGAGEGHRVAHCACRKSPYADSGYRLELADGPAPKRRQRPADEWCSTGGCGNCPAERHGLRGVAS